MKHGCADWNILGDGLRAFSLESLLVGSPRCVPIGNETSNDQLPRLSLASKNRFPVSQIYQLL